MNLVRELDLECHQEADSLKRVGASIHVVTQEEVVVTFNVATVVRDAPKVEESHQVLVLTVDVAEDLDRSIDSQNHRLFLENPHALVSES